MKDFNQIQSKKPDSINSIKEITRFKKKCSELGQVKFADDSL